MPPSDATLQPTLSGQPAELEQLGTRLASRKSITWLARGFVLANASVIVVGIAMLLMIQSKRMPFLFAPFAVIGLGTVVGAVYAFVRGGRLLASEREDFLRYQDLRRAAGLDA